MPRHDGHKASQATMLWLLRDEGLILPSEYAKQRRELAKDRKAGVREDPERPRSRCGNWIVPEFETTAGRTWWIAGCRDWYSKLEYPLPYLVDCEPA